MKTKARLAKSEFDEGASVSVTRKRNFLSSSLHGHDFYELDIIISGATNTAINGKRLLAKPGDIFFMTPTDFHEYTDSFDIYNVQFTGEAVSAEILERFIEAKQPIYSPGKDCFEKILRTVNLMDEIAKSVKSSNDILTKLLEAILLLLSNDEDVSLCNEAVPNKDMQKAVTYVRTHFKENPSLSEVAALFPLNENYFCTKFKEYTGFTYKEYLKKIKLRYARRLIYATNLSMIEVAENCGYSSQSHFNRDFKKYYGVSPLHLKKDR